MRTRKRLLCACAALLCVMGVAVDAHAREVELSARGAVLLEATTGKVLWAKNAHERLPMASTTKIMTAVVALENGDPEALVEVKADAYGVEGSSMYLKLGEKLTLRDLLHGLMLVSGNDAAAAIASHVGGGIENFIAMMNAKAAALGLANTHFVTPNGLHDDAHYTTAYDLAVIAAYAMQNPAFRELVSTQYYKTTTGDHVRTLQNRNKILWRYDGGNGIKTGYTSKAGKCLAFAALRDNMQLIGVVLRSADTYGDAFSLLDHGFSHYIMRSILRAGDTVAYVRVQGGVKNSLALYAAQDIILPVDANEDSNVTTQLVLAPLQAPLKKDAECGSMVFMENGRTLARTALLAQRDVEIPDIAYYLGRCLEYWGAP